MVSFVHIFDWLFLFIVVAWIAIILGTLLLTVLAFVAGLLGCKPPGSHDWSRDRRRPPISMALRTAVLNRDGWECTYCGSKKNLQLDHFVPFSRGGATTYENLVTSCAYCNEKKGAK